MSKGLKTALIIIGVLIVAGGVLAAGFAAGKASHWFKQESAQVNGSNEQYPQGGFGWRGPQEMEPRSGMDKHSFGKRPEGTLPQRNDASPYRQPPEQFPHGDSYAPRDGGSPGGMMGGFAQTCPYFGEQTTSNVQPLTIEEVKTSVENYLKKLGNDDLIIEKILVFDRNAYVRIVEKSSGIGAMELLVDPSSKTVYPELGPNRMWNLKYGGRGGTMGRSSQLQGVDGTDMTVNAADAVKAAQEYLDTCNTGATVSEAEPFYGYYALDVVKDGQPVGVLSVNGYTGQVFYHHWLGKLLTTSEES